MKKIVSVRQLKDFRKAQKLNQKEMADLIGVSHRSYSDYETGKTQIPQPISNFIWILINNKNADSANGEINEPNTSYKTSNNRQIPLIPIDAMAGFGTGEMQVMDYDGEYYMVPEFEDLNVDFMVGVKGSSMYPSYNSGDVVACKKLPLDTFFQWNKVYVLDTIQGPMIKRIHKSDNKGSILCVSDNEKYPPFDLPLKEVYSLAIVLGVIRLV